ncbi:MAG: hypothetical protein BWZ10_01172 [candidate division BRC1 bacterium ADurb.BinA364]|nr:MAG: hypothetical protein BWZ10_01172 [candidate division BRC1 bacterium ADurb.BinA364]
MAVRFNQWLDKSLCYYDFSVERRYADYLKETGRAIVIDNLIVDAPNVVERKFLCHTDLCLGKRPEKGMRGKGCCSTFDVRVAPDEVKRIEPMLPRIKERFPYIARAIDQEGGEWWHYDAEDYNKTLNIKENGGCIFLGPRENGIFPCALHALALEDGLDPKRLKPSACIMYPLFMIELDDNEYLLTCTCAETHPVICGAETEHHDFPCLNPNGKAAEPLYKAMGGVIEMMFGESAYRRLCREAQQRGF